MQYKGFSRQQQQTLAPQSVLAELSQLPIPEAVEDEYGILSCIFNSYDAASTFREAASLLRPEHFVTPTLQDIWRGILKAHKENLPTEFRVQANYLQDFAQINSDVLKGVLNHISESLHDPDNISHYAERIVRKWESRELLRALSTGARAALDSSVPPEEALVIAERNLREVRDGLASRQTRRTGLAKNIGRNMIDSLRKIAKGELQRDVVKTNCWYEFDQACQGFLPGEIVVIGAPPSGGKTTMGAGLANAFSEQGIFTLWISLEDDPDKCYAKILAAKAKTTQGAITRGDDLGLADIDKLEAIVEKGSNHLIITQPMTMSVDGIEQAIAQAESDMREEHGENFTGFRVVIFDYLQYLGEFVEDNRKTSVISSATARIGSLCKQMNATLFAFAQYNTEIAKGKRPTDIMVFADCNSISKHADMIIGLHCDGYANREQLHTFKTIECIWIKNRCGGNAAIKLGIDWVHGWIYSLLGSSPTDTYPTDIARTVAPKTITASGDDSEVTEEIPGEAPAPLEEFDDREEDFAAKYNDPDLEVVGLPEPPKVTIDMNVSPVTDRAAEETVALLEEIIDAEQKELETVGVSFGEFEVGERVLYCGHQGVETPARFLGVDENDPLCVRIEFIGELEDPHGASSGKKYLREKGAVRSVIPSRLKKATV